MPPKLTAEAIEQRLVAMARHGFDLNVLELLDVFQLHSLITHCDLGPSCRFPDSFPKKNIQHHYTKLRKDFKVPGNLLAKAVAAFSSMEPSDVLNDDRFIPVVGTVPKHYRQKPKIKGVGATSAILTEDTTSFLFFLEYLLCFHAFCRYSFTLPRKMQDNIELIDFGSRTLVQYFEKMVYRGDDSVDSRTTKVHANKRAGLNHQCLGSCMHADCQTGERLLKTKAKGISSTAQQRGNSTFERQSMHRIQEETILSKYELFLIDQELNTSKKKKKTLDSSGQPTVSRRVPNFRYDASTSQWLQLDRKGKVSGIAQINQAITEALFEVEPTLDVYEIHGEVLLADRSRIRATPNYCQSGPWYDFVNVKWDVQPEPKLFPARCLAFYQKNDCDDPVGSPQLMALVHGADSKRPEGTGRRDSTMLTSQFFLEYTNTKKPKIYAIPVTTIESAVLCFPHEPSPRQDASSLFDSRNVGIMVVRPRNEWAYVWMAWIDTLRESNCSTRVKKRKAYVDLGGPNEMRGVTKKLAMYLKPDEISNLMPL